MWRKFTGEVQPSSTIGWLGRGPISKELRPSGKFLQRRYKGSVGPGVIRDLRGAMDGRADKGLLLTTGTFTPDARGEAQRAGATPIDLIDGEELVERLKQLKMGVDIKTQVVEEVVVNRKWFDEV